VAKKGIKMSAVPEKIRIKIKKGKRAGRKEGGEKRGRPDVL
jgi:hypothetical protein